MTDELEALLRQAEEHDRKATPGPWRSHVPPQQHRANSPYCKETCGRGSVPLAVREMTPEERRAAKEFPDSEWKLHDLSGDCVEDIIAADEAHVVCFGHDYGDYGAVSVSDAAFIAWARNNLRALVTAIRDQHADLQAASRALEHAHEWLDELGCDCGTDEPGTCAWCESRAALARPGVQEAAKGGGDGE